MAESNLVCFNGLLVNAISNNSGIFVGTNSQADWKSNSNSKFGFGNLVGSSNVISRAVNIFTDNDLLDMPIFTQNITEAIEKKSEEPEEKSEPESMSVPDKDASIIVLKGHKKPRDD